MYIHMYVSLHLSLSLYIQIYTHAYVRSIHIWRLRETMACKQRWLAYLLPNSLKFALTRVMDTVRWKEFFSLEEEW